MPPIPAKSASCSAASSRRGGASIPTRASIRATTTRTFVAVVGSELVGELHIEPTPFGFGEVGMMVAAGWRGRGVGTALLLASVAWARERGLHKLSLGVFPSNEPALALYRRFGFVQEGRRVKHIRRANGDLWDLVEMGLLL